MLIPILGQHLQIASREEAVRLCTVDRNFWSVISIRGTTSPRVALQGAKRVHDLCFDDIETDKVGPELRGASARAISGAIAFAESVERDPLLVHCAAGISRSTAVALAWIYRRLEDQPDAAARSVETLIHVRPQASPNAWVLRLGLQAFMPSARAAEVANELLECPDLRRNRSMQH